MSDEFEIVDAHSTFDFKGFLFKLLSYWPLFIISLAIGFGIAYYINVRKLPIYRLDTSVSIKDDQNPFFTSNTSLTFNWGGTTDKVNTATIILKSRTHNEMVVDRLQFYTNYYKEGKYQQVDAYKKAPFIIKVDTSEYQVLGKQLQIQFINATTFVLSTVVEEDRNFTFQHYGTKEKKSKYFEAQNYSEEYKLGQKIKTPFFIGTIVPNPEMEVRPNSTYHISFSNFDSVVKGFMGIKIKPETKGGSVLRLSLVNKNKFRIVDYLNSSVQVLSDHMLERKNLFATKTIKFIDSSLADKNKELKDVEADLNSFRDKNAIYNLDAEGQKLSGRLNSLDLEKEEINRQLDYYNILETYLLTRTDYREIPAPSVAGITEGSITASVGRIVVLAEERSNLEYSFKEGAPVFKDIDRQINAVKEVLLENINSSKGLLNDEIKNINKNIARFEAEIKKLPKEQQELFKIERRYNLSQGIYNLFLAKRSEAGMVKAANVSDVMVIDAAKDTGGGKVGPNTQLNYMMAFIFGLFIPFLIVFIRVFFNTKVTTFQDIERLSKIPILGVVGKNRTGENLAVLKKSQSAIAESFRGLRSGLQFFYKKQGIDGSKTVLLTSSIGGEGKTFCSINIASVFALSNKKTIIVGLDLRKPKIFGDFGIENNIGVVNYLVHDAKLADIIDKTEVPYLDVITSGEIPPNPSELLMSDRMDTLINELKQEYDYIILDSPPIGLVADSLVLTKYADAILYLIRQNYTKRGMFNFINDKYKNGEVTNISFVLNYFEEKIGYGYGYGYGNYSNAYHEDDKKPSLLKRIKNIFNKKS